MIKTKYYIFLSALLTSLYGLGQDYDNIRIKEEFDKHNKVLIQNRYNPCSTSTNDDDEIYGDGMCHVLEGYITMYETTKDKAYLYKFILESLCMMGNRNDYAEVEPIPRWDAKSLYKNGNIIAPFARFVHFVKNNPELYSTVLYQFSEIANNSFSVQFNTFGEYANWLQDRCGETLWWFTSNGYWIADGFRKSTTATIPAEINMQSGFGRALLYIGLVANEPAFLDKAMVLANKYKSNLSLSDPCEHKSFNNPVFQITPDNSYQWYHRGWQVEKKNCWSNKFPFHHTNVDDYSKYTEFKEDISHGAPVTWLPNDFLKYQPNTPFNQTDMVRFKNMFAKRIYAGNGNFHNAVDGTDNPVSCTNCGTDLPINYFIYEFTPLSYIYLSRYDDLETTSPTVYKIVMEDYLSKISGKSSLSNVYGGMANKGHAEVVQEQWRRECTNLTLYNRKVVYDQDFFAKNTLEIAPQKTDYLHQQNDYSFAEPKITENTFEIENGVKTTITAGKEIVLKPGTHIKAGANVHLKIDPFLCQDSESGIQQNSDVAKSINLKLDDTTQIMVIDKVVKSELLIFPNPIKGVISVLNQQINEKEANEYTIYTLEGKEVEHGNIINMQIFTNLSRGVYL